ncbi:MAG: SurA N-terminal domain-containing protein [Clostridia bacterium]|nr:SurA N-terminal domain-containing protein [Clostridia bacterium]
MNKRIWKLTALVLALLLALTGCSLIEVDQEMDNAEVVATVNGTSITKGEVKDTYDYYVSYYQYLNSYYGLSYDEASTKDDVLEAFIRRELIKQKAAELGLDAITDEDKAAIEAQAADELEEYIAEHAEDVNTAGMTSEEAHAAVLAHLEEEGITLQALIDSDTDSFISDRVRESVIADVKVEDSAIEEAYNSEVADDETTFTSSTYLYELYRTNGTTTIYWNPEGYRTVKHILLKLTDEQSAALTALEDELSGVEASITALENPVEEEAEAETAEGETEATDETAEETAEEPAEEEPALSLEELTARKAELEKAIEDEKADIVASFSEKVDEIMAKFNDGAAFDDLVAEYGEDPGMQTEPGKTEGYYVSATSTAWESTFAEAAMALEKVGDVSEPVLGSNGLHIIYYNSDVTPGPVAIDEVRDELSESLLETAQDDAYDAAYQSWYDAAKIQKFPGRLS